MKSYKDTFTIGFLFLLFCGLIGLVCFLFDVIFIDYNIVYEATPFEYFGCFMIGIQTSLGIVLSNIAAGIGIAGISNSIV